MQEEVYLTVEEICRELRVTKKVVYSWIKQGKLPALKTGKEYRIARVDYQDFKDRLRKRPTTT